MKKTIEPAETAMQYARIAGLPRLVSRLLLGSISLRDEPEDCLHQAFELFDAFVARGGNMIDTARIYGAGSLVRFARTLWSRRDPVQAVRAFNGASERVIGRWMEARGNRSQVMIETKGAHSGNPARLRVTPEAIAHDLQRSLERLRTDYVDLYLLHQDDPSVPVGRIVDCLNEHAEAGRILAFGGANWTYARIEEANGYAATHGLRSFVVSSSHLSLARTLQPRWPGSLTVDAETLRQRGAQQLPLLAWSSQAGGFFSGRFSPDDRRNAEIVRTYYSEDNWERLRRAGELAQEKGCAPIQIALAWVLNQPIPVFAIIGPRRLEELRSSVAALDLHLSPEELAWLNLERERR